MTSNARHSGGMRYRVTLHLMHPLPPVDHEVATLYGELKAVVLATRAHAASGRGHILSVDVVPLPGAKPEGSDLIDRLEW